MAILLLVLLLVAGIGMRVRWKAVGSVAVLALVVAGCGANGDRESATTRSDPAATTARYSPTPTHAAHLHQFLIRADEAPGLSPSGEPLEVLSLTAFVEEFDASEAEERRLRDHGFQLRITQMLAAPDADGISSVNLFATEDGAARELDYLLSNKAADAPPGIENFERFDVPGVPGAVGWTFDKPGGHNAANVHWRQGRCLLNLGVEPASIDQLRTGVRALHDRTGGRCP